MLFFHQNKIYPCYELKQKQNISLNKVTLLRKK
jgi:hypothetical protein